ncbi:MAG: hypothetical protein GTN89_16685 [Acidobacteria bacterium]|nr:hypothetical protein [Acidobacteriota bacterium]NIM63285.1 hypothetical protein [Acidobacteriota bacterium]NIO60857.1 hypothetical protein [Acidobacteriota bacterium]NIQ31936.1 hypothetical protein [Acidobacteriota bacterium]NIQ87312.1 hypothetical protein [Acidobacteriota bacterium]
MSQDLAPVSLLVIHRVADYDAWREVFDARLSARKQAGFLGHNVTRGADDPQTVCVYLPCSDVDNARGYLQRADVVQALKDSGVEGSPTAYLTRPMFGEVISDKLLPAIIVHHGVEDYDAWVKVYNDFDLYRKESGIVGHAVDQGFDDPNNVIVYHQAEALTTLRAFVDSNELKERMRDGGVKEPFEIRFVEEVDAAEY